MIGGYYQARGLNEDGFVPQEKLQIGLKTIRNSSDEEDSAKFFEQLELLEQRTVNE